MGGLCGEIDRCCSSKHSLRAITGLSADQSPPPRVNAELLSKFTLGCDRAYLHVRPEGELSCEAGEGYDRALGERSRGIPAVHITGHQEFWGMDFIVNSRCPDSAPRDRTRR
jgi:release factor glutamine methyltransferase